MSMAFEFNSVMTSPIGRATAPGSAPLAKGNGWEPVLQPLMSLTGAETKAKPVKPYTPNELSRIYKAVALPVVETGDHLYAFGTMVANAPIFSASFLSSTSEPAKNPAADTALRNLGVDPASLGGEDPVLALARVLSARSMGLPNNTSQRYLDLKKNTNPALVQVVRSDQIADMTETRRLADLKKTVDANGYPAAPKLLPDTTSTPEEQAAFRMGVKDWQGMTADRLQKETAKLQGISQERIDANPAEASFQNNLNSALNFLQSKGISTGLGTYEDMVRGYALYFGLPSTSTWADVFEAWRNAENGGAQMVRDGKLPVSQEQPVWDKLKTEKGAQLKMPDGVTVPTYTPPSPTRRSFVPPNLPTSTGSPPRVLVIDKFNFENNDPNNVDTRIGVDVDGDGKADITHGEAVGRYIHSELPEARIEVLDLNAQTDILQLFNRVSESVRQDKANGNAPLQAINFSQTSSYQITIQPPPGTPGPARVETRFTSVEELGQVVGIDLKPDNIAANKTQVKTELARLATMLRENKQTEFNQLMQSRKIDPDVARRYLGWWEAVKAMESITTQGVPVYLGAGNNGTLPSGQHQLNMFSLADGAIAVGALDRDGKPIAGYADNTLITQRAKGQFLVKATPEGVDITGDDRSDVTSAYFTSKKTFTRTDHYVQGSSFAAPTLLGQQVKAKIRQPAAK